MATLGWGIDARRAGIDDTPLQVAALPYRVAADGSIQFLLVTSRTSRRWIIPKGWPVKGLSLAESAAREAYEEAGVRGIAEEREIARFPLEKGQVPVTYPVAIFPLPVRRDLPRWPEMAQRERAWLSRTDAAERVDVPIVRQLILSFEPTMRN